MKADALKCQGKRTDILSDEDASADKATPVLGMKDVGNQNGDSLSTVKRYIRLTHLQTELLDLVDAEILSVGAGYLLSFLNSIEQGYLVDYYKECRLVPNGAQIEEITRYHDMGTLDADVIKTIMQKPREQKAQKVNITLKDKRLKNIFLRMHQRNIWNR